MVLNESDIVYCIGAVPLVVLIVINFFSSSSGGMWTSGKPSMTISASGFVYLIFFIVWTLIWGGFFWW